MHRSSRYIYIYIYIYISSYILPIASYHLISCPHLKDLDVVPYAFWHLEDLEVVPHPRGQMLSTMKSLNKQRNRKWEKIPKPKIRLVIYISFHFLQKVEYDRIRVRLKTIKKDMFAEKGISLNNSSLKLKAWFRIKVKKSMNFTFDKWVHNVIPVTNPTQYTKFGKYKVKIKQI